MATMPELPFGQCSTSLGHMVGWGPAYMQTIPPAPCHGGGGGSGGGGDLGVAAVGIKATVWKK